MTDNQIDFNEVLGEEGSAEAREANPAQELLGMVDALVSSVGHKFGEVDSNFAAIDGRLGLVEKFLAFLLEQNPDIVSKIKAHAQAEAEKWKAEQENADVGEVEKGP